MWWEPEVAGEGLAIADSRSTKLAALAFSWQEGQGGRGRGQGGVHHSPGVLAVLETQPGLLEYMGTLGQIVYLKSYMWLAFAFLS